MANDADDEAADLEPALVDRDSFPRRRAKETEAQHDRRMGDLYVQTYGPPKSTITDAQIDDIVGRISKAVVDAVTVQVRADAAAAVRKAISDAFGQLAFTAGKVLD